MIKRGDTYKRLITSCLLLVAVIFIVPAKAQNFRYNQLELGIAAGGMTYIGDLNNQSIIGSVSPGGMVMLRYNPNNRWTLQISGGYGMVEGGNPDAIELRNLSFRSKIIEASIQVQFNFLPYGNSTGSFPWTPYIYAGIGVFGFNPKAKYTDPNTGEISWHELQPLGTEGQGTPLYPERAKYSLMEKVMPFGLGVKWKATKYLTLGAEYGFRKTWTDYLDDVSATYVGRELLNSYGGKMAAILGDRSNEVIPGYVNAIGMQRGDDSLSDWYTFFGITVTIQMDAIMSVLGLGPKCESGW